MHTGDALPFVSPEAEMTKAVVEISSKRLGVAIVIDSSKKILGVLTDGDIRRGIEKQGKGFFDTKVGEVMTKNPKTIAEDELAVKALSIMETHSITSLAVPDSDGKAIGVIHLHDILKQGIA
jgi:arabinose-5-phosphate isomerase